MEKYRRIFTIVLDSLGIGAMDNAADYGDEAVSYTHLDVYKRQVFASFVSPVS